MVDVEIVKGQDFKIVCLLYSREEVGDGLLILIVERHPHLSTSNGSFFPLPTHLPPAWPQLPRFFPLVRRADEGPALPIFCFVVIHVLEEIGMGEVVVASFQSIFMPSLDVHINHRAYRVFQFVEEEKARRMSLTPFR